MRKIALRKVALSIACVSLGLFFVFGIAASQESLLSRIAGVFTGSGNGATPGTHQHKGTISLAISDQHVEIRTFCVDKKGRLLVASGGTQFAYQTSPDGSYGLEQVETPSSIHVFSPDGKEEAVWKIEVTPEALAVGPDNTVYAAGMGKIVHLSETGVVLKTVDSLHLEHLPPLPEIPGETADTETAEQKAAKQKRLAEMQTEQQEILKKYSEKYAELQKAQQQKDEDAVIKLSAEIETILETEYMPLMEERQALTTSPRQQAIAARNSLLQARSVKSIGVTDKHLFVCTPPARGYASEVWRLDKDFTNPKVIVRGLSGCCGQMNISAVGDKLVIPENGRFKVHVYDAEGNRLESWGDNEQGNAKTGWGSCCNPMNVAFDAAGNVLTSEASVGAIKRFTLDGTFIDQVAQSKIVPGCKHTPIGMSLDGSKAYILDITRRNIIVMEKP
ncbi:MAG: hypothetical protein FWE95_04635 [Planctomycetaceae bacterium]|nr:hypothetical protein [Planctomycetaceae bacterium]